MISGIGSNLTNSTINNLQNTNQSQAIAALLAGGNDPDGDGDVDAVGAADSDSAKISGPAQLFSQLQQLQSQDPTKFKQVLSDISTQLQGAAQQTTGAQSQFLTDLASKFQTAASTGDLSALQPPRHHHAHGTYNQQGQIAPPPSAIGTNTTGGASSSGGTDLGQLFANIAKEVAQAVGA